MSLINKADVKNHLSARHRSEIHLAPPQSQSDATGFAHEDSASEDPEVSDSVESTLIPPGLTDADATAAATSKSAKA